MKARISCGDGFSRIRMTLISGRVPARCQTVESVRGVGSVSSGGGTNCSERGTSPSLSQRRATSSMPMHPTTCAPSCDRNDTNMPVALSGATATSSRGTNSDASAVPRHCGVSPVIAASRPPIRIPSASTKCSTARPDAGMSRHAASRPSSRNRSRVPAGSWGSPAGRDAF